jgi:hypothetical protein
VQAIHADIAIHVGDQRAVYRSTKTAPSPIAISRTSSFIARMTESGMERWRPLIRPAAFVDDCDPTALCGVTAQQRRQELAGIRRARDYHRRKRVNADVGAVGVIVTGGSSGE